MLSLPPSTQIFLVAGVTDMRKGINGLAAIVAHKIHLDPLSGHLFVFTNRRRNRVKILLWDRTGFWLATKRLERGTFAWPSTNEKSVTLTSEELTLLLGGIDLRATKQRRWYTREEDETLKARIAEKISKLSLLSA
jgi:transposase